MQIQFCTGVLRPFLETFVCVYIKRALKIWQQIDAQVSYSRGTNLPHTPGQHPDAAGLKVKNQEKHLPPPKKRLKNIYPSQHIIWSAASSWDNY